MTIGYNGVLTPAQQAQRLALFKRAFATLSSSQGQLNVAISYLLDVCKVSGMSLATCGDLTYTISALQNIALTQQNVLSNLKNAK